MIEEVLPNLFCLQIPLPDNPLKYVNSYVIPEKDRSLIIDTGLNRDECLSAMMEGLAAIQVDPKKSFFFITHLHADHFGLIMRLATDPHQIYFSRPESEIIESWTGWEPMVEYAGRNGFPKEWLNQALKAHPGFKYGSKWLPDMRVLDDRDMITFGDYNFRCVTTPGHTRGHICLYEAEKKVLISGDHILGDITPNIQCWSDGENPLHDYLASLDKVGALDIDLVLPGHRRRIENITARIEELKEHHRRRLEEVLEILTQGPQHAYDVASRMTWDLDGSFADFPMAQKWFAVAEATAHLRYLEEGGDIGRETTNGIILYRG